VERLREFWEQITADPLRAWLAPWFDGGKTPVDIVNEQAKFWQTAVADYTEGSKRLTAAGSR